MSNLQHVYMVYNNNNSDNMTLQGEDDKADDEVNLETDPVLFLERIGKEQKFDVTFVEIEEVSKSVSNFFDFHIRAYAYTVCITIISVFKCIVFYPIDN